MPGGRKPAVGRFQTRGELLDFVWREWITSRRNTTQIALAARVGYGVISRILKVKEGFEPAKYSPPDPAEIRRRARES